MKLNDLMGQIHINESTIFDPHLLWLLVPVFIAVALFLTKPSQWNKKSKDLAVRTSSFVLLASVAFAIVGKFQYQSFNETMSSLDIFTNIDVVVGLLFGITLLTKRFWLTRVLIPGAIVISLMRIINNPGGFIDYTELIVDLVLVSVSMVLIPVFNRTITVTAHALLVLATLVTLTYVFVYNKLSSTNFSTLSLPEIASNPFYNWMDNYVLVIFAFLSVIVFFETIIWLAIRTWFSVSTRKDKHESAFASVKYEWMLIKNAVNSHMNRYEIANQIYMDAVLSEELDSQETQNKDVDMLENLEEQIEGPKDTFILPTQLVEVKTSKGIRAPSLA